MSYIAAAVPPSKKHKKEDVFLGKVLEYGPLIPEYFLSKVHWKAEAQRCQPQVFGCRGEFGGIGNVKFDEDFFFTGREMLIGLVQMAERFPDAALYFSLTRFPDICSMEKTSISALGALRCISASIS